MNLPQALEESTPSSRPAAVDVSEHGAGSLTAESDGPMIDDPKASVATQSSRQGPSRQGPSRQRPSLSTLPDRWIGRFLLSLAKDLPIEIELWDGQVFSASGDSEHQRVTIHTRSALWDLLLSPSLAFGDGYTQNEITVSGDLLKFCEGMELAAQRVPGWFDNYVWRWLHWLTPNTRSKSKRRIHRHYDLGNEFFKLWLDETMAYTCAYFSEPGLDLTAAQTAKFDHVARKLRLKPGDHVVEAGCGWGGLALHLAKNYDVSVTAYNISHEQVVYAREQAIAEGLSHRVAFIEDDWRSIDGLFDAFVSVGMLEHVGLENYRELGRLIQRSLKPDGLALLHTIGRNIAKPVDRWTEKRIFPGSCPPSLRQMMDIFEAGELSVLDVENLRLHYARTLEFWRDNFELHAADVERMLDANFVRMWRLYLNGSVAAFRKGGLQLFQVVVAHAQNHAVPWTRADLYAESSHAGVF